MKISSEDLKDDGEKVYSVNTNSNKTEGGKYKKGDVSIDLSDPKEIYSKSVFAYIEENTLKVASSLENALKVRHNGEFVLSLRECDIAARGKLDLSDGSTLREGLLNSNFGFYISEGDIDEDENNIWRLRKHYNVGVDWMKKYKDEATEKRVNKASNRLKEIQKSIEVILPMWPEEVDNGYNIELLKPEYMTFIQFERDKRKKGLRW